MKEIVMIIRPEKLEIVKQILHKNGCGGMTISSVMGCGTQRGMSDAFDIPNVIKGYKVAINVLPKIKVEAVLEDEKIDKLITEICENIATGLVGDGKIFVRNIEEAVRIRTGERGVKAL